MMQAQSNVLVINPIISLPFSLLAFMTAYVVARLVA